MKISIMPKHTAAELLLFLADHEEFSSVSKMLEGEIKSEEVCALLREISAGLLKESSKEVGDERFEVKGNTHLSPQTKNILSYLSPHEEETLLKAFGLVEKP